MRIANVSGRLALVTDEGGIDVETASAGRFGPDPQAIYGQWQAFRAWADHAPSGPATAIDNNELGPPAPRPAQVFAIGMNYRDHAAEAGLEVPASPATFTKFPTCITAPFAHVILPSEYVDWEVELVVVIGVRAYQVSHASAWDHVAGVMVGQDLSDRVVQFASGGQFSLGKSFPGFGPTGPWLVTPDELADPDDLELGCSLDGCQVQKSRTSQLIFSVPELIVQLSAVLPLLPGDLIFTGTPAGIGATRRPPQFLHPGQVLTSYIEGVGTMANRLISSPA
ncbi:MAG: fumarylacetoacetate hydrolase family protein [Actinomycetota bacterium]|nr:fumarylacetoacetate hydrolase family protein [Actinomycetota bacterium]